LVRKRYTLSLALGVQKWVTTGVSTMDHSDDFVFNKIRVILFCTIICLIKLLYSMIKKNARLYIGCVKAIQINTKKYKHKREGG
jgi:hypothetical protein